MVEAWTGVIRVKPMIDIASSSHGDKDGLRLLNARDEPDFVEGPLLGAIVVYVLVKAITVCAAEVRKKVIGYSGDNRHRYHHVAAQPLTGNLASDTASATVLNLMQDFRVPKFVAMSHLSSPTTPNLF